MSFISSPSEFMKVYPSHRHVVTNSISSSVPSKKFKITDVYVQTDDRQLIYAFDNELVINVRNGCTIIETKNQIFWGRKALPYTFEYRLEYLGSRLNDDSEAIIEGIFSKSKQVFSRELIDGINTQVTYLPQLQAWNIASSNYSLVAMNQTDVKQYEQDFGKDNPIFQVAHHWFTKIQKLKGYQLKQLKSILTDHTLVGNLVTSNYIVKYKREHVFIWQARINHFSNSVCLDMFETKKLLSWLGFEFAKTKSMGVINNYNHFIQFSQNLVSKTLQASVSSKQLGKMGAMIYFVEHKPYGNDIQLEVIGCTKVLTLQYQIYDHISFLLCLVSQNVESKQIEQESIQQFQQQWSDKISIYKHFPKYPLNHYSLILKLGMQAVIKLKLSKKFIQNNFNQLISSILYSYVKKHQVSKLLIESKVLDIGLQNVQFSQFGAIGCKNITVYIPLSIPGLGKTYLSKILQNTLKRSESNLIIINKILTQDNLQTILNQQIDESNKDHHYIYLDIDGKYQQLLKMIRKIQELKNQNYYYRFIYIVPENRILIKDDEYPFSVQNVLVSLKNSIKKSEQHHHILQTLNILKSYKSINVTQKGQQNSEEYMYPFVKCKINGEKEYLLEKIYKLFMVNKIKEQSIEEIIGFMKNVDIVYPNAQVIENEIDELLSRSVIKIPTVHLQ